MKINILFKTMLLISYLVISMAYAEPNIWVSDVNARFGIIDVATGSINIIIKQGYIYFDIAFDSNGNLYGADPSKLYSINKTTGLGAVIGSLGVSDRNSIAFSPNGTLYMLGYLSNNLYTIDTKTGKSTVVFNTGYNYGFGLEFFNGNLYFTDGYNLLSINLSNQKTVLIGSISANIDSLVATNNGALYGIGNNSIYSINTSTGEGTLITTYASGLGNIFGAAFYRGANECLFNWAENNYQNLFSPASSSLFFYASYNYRYYSANNAYLGISSADDHVYYIGSDGNLQDEGSLSYWLPISNCQTIPRPKIECLFNWAERAYPTLFSPAHNSSLASTPYTYYRSYSATNTILRISSASNRVFYQDSNGTLQDAGSLSNWLSVANCW